MSYILFSVPVSSVDVQLSHQRFEGRPDSLGVFEFSFFAIFTSRLSFTWFLHARVLILDHLE